MGKLWEIVGKNRPIELQVLTDHSHISPISSALIFCHGGKSEKIFW